MTGEKRRRQIMELLQQSSEPLSGGQLAKKLGVTRQVIVSDVALLRASHREILSTTRGYLLYDQKPQKKQRCFSVKHTNEQIADELRMIVSLGGEVRNVIVLHEIYGEISADLMIGHERDIEAFLEKVERLETVPLKDLTGGIHLHLVEAEEIEILDRIEEQLRQKGYLFHENE